MFQLLDIGDDTSIEICHCGDIKLSAPTAGVSEQDDLILRAATLLKQASNSPMGANLRVNKKLPMGAGLGGGSSNAATVLYALNHLWKTGLTIDELANIGLTLGADVPVFIHGASAWAEGIGDRLTPLILPNRWFLVLNPNIHVATAKVFADPALTRNSSAITIRDFLGRELNATIHNDCQSVVMVRYPEIGEALNWLATHVALNQTASGPVGMTGTGSSLYAVFADEHSAQSVLEKIPAPWTGFVARGVNISPLHKVLKI